MDLSLGMKIDDWAPPQPVTTKAEDENI